MKGYGQFCPIARTLDLVGDRWTLLIVRELLRGKRRFRDIEAGLRGIPPNLLADRLKVLEQAGIINRRYFRELPPRVEYALTERGRGLAPVLDSLAGWGMQLLAAGDAPDEGIDPELVLFHLARFFHDERAAGLRATVQLQLEGDSCGMCWAEVSEGAFRVFTEEPPRSDATIACPTSMFVRFLAGQLDTVALLTGPEARVSGDEALGRRFLSLLETGR